MISSKFRRNYGGTHCSPFVLAALEIFDMAVGAQWSNVLRSTLEGGLLEVTTITSFGLVLMKKDYERHLLSRGPESMRSH
jgi:hypothetical protein